MNYPPGMGYTPGELADAIEAEWKAAPEPRPFDWPTRRVRADLLDLLDAMRPLLFAPWRPE